MASSTSGTGNDYNFKVVLLGEGCVGKTSLALRYVEDKFNDKHISTVQVKDIPDIQDPHFRFSFSPILLVYTFKSIIIMFLYDRLIYSYDSFNY